MSENIEHSNSRSGTIKVTWSQCPNRECVSRNFDKWDVNFDDDEFCCGTCETALERPIFLPHVAGKWDEILCKDCRKFIEIPDREQFEQHKRLPGEERRKG